MGSITPTKVSVMYTDFANVFFPDLASELPKYTGVNNHVIELVNANGFIRPSKLPVGAPIFSNQEPDGSLVPITEASIMFPIMLVLMAMTGLTLQDKLEKV